MGPYTSFISDAQLTDMARNGNMNSPAVQYSSEYQQDDLYDDEADTPMPNTSDAPDEEAEEVPAEVINVPSSPPAATPGDPKRARPGLYYVAAANGRKDKDEIIDYSELDQAGWPVGTIIQLYQPLEAEFAHCLDLSVGVPYNALLIIYWYFGENITQTDIAKMLPQYVKCKDDKMSPQSVQKRLNKENGWPLFMQKYPQEATILKSRRDDALKAKSEARENRRGRGQGKGKGQGVSTTTNGEGDEAVPIKDSATSRRARKLHARRMRFGKYVTDILSQLSHPQCRKLESIVWKLRTTPSEIAMKHAVMRQGAKALITKFRSVLHSYTHLLTFTATNEKTGEAQIPASALPKPGSYASSSMFPPLSWPGNNSAVYRRVISAPWTSFRTISRYAQIMSSELDSLPLFDLNFKNLAAPAAPNHQQRPVSSSNSRLKLTEIAWTSSALFELYVLSLAFGNPEVCDIVMHTLLGHRANLFERGEGQTLALAREICYVLENVPSEAPITRFLWDVLVKNRWLLAYIDAQHDGRVYLRKCRDIGKEDAEEARDRLERGACPEDKEEGWDADVVERYFFHDKGVEMDWEDLGPRWRMHSDCMSDDDECFWCLEDKVLE